MTVEATPDITWEPGPRQLERSRLQALMRRHGIDTYADFYARSIDDPEWFWEAVVRDELELVWSRPYDRVLDLSDGPAWPHWFVGGRLNYVANAVDRHVTGDRGGAAALIWEGEEGTTRTLTYRELQREVNRVAGGLRELGLEKGDRVAIFMPMIPETAIATLACSKVGAIYIPIFSGYGTNAVALRLRDAGARLLICADGFYRRGRAVPMKATADAAVELSPDVERVLVVRRSGAEVPWTEGRDVWWDDLVQSQSDDAETLDTSADDPFMIIYTSGTTGRPKGAFHVHAGFPLKAAQDMAHCFDVHADDTLFWFTDIGWMMGPWAIMGTLILGGTLFLYDGTPDYPEPDRIWQMVERHHISVLGIAPTVIRALMPHGDEWVRKHDLSSLRVLGGSGEPWNPGPWTWYLQTVGGGRCPIINYSGGTETSGGILGCTTILPERPTSFSTPVPGMAADVLDEQGNSVRGKVGELVVRKPWVGMTHGFWGDRDRYIETYWSRFPGIWTHGDWALVDPDGYWYILGRSDDTLKVAGKRVGPAEVESAAVSHRSVLEAAAIGVPHEVKGETVTVFVILRPGHEPSDEVRGEIRQAIGEQLGKALLPEEVRFVSDLPRTRNAKIMRRVIRARYLGRELGDVTSLENPAAIEAIAQST
ncbi:MAG TPA: acetate--CoA ligase [Chloroflexota bacterium]|nr:acetate--CoA ligase [Chloroflexota bacterium]